MNKQTKPWWKSRTVIASLVTVVASLLGMFGLDVDQAALTDFLLQTATLISGAIALWGRVVAEKMISKGDEA